MKIKLSMFSLLLGFILAAVVCTQPAQADESYMNAGMQHFYAGEWDTAVSCFNKVIEEDPHNTLALAYILDAYFHKKDVDGIVNKMEVRSAAAGETAEVRAQLGMAYFLRGKIQPALLEEALTEFKEALAEDSQNSLAYAGTGMVYFQKRMMPRAKGYFVRALRLNNHDVMAMDRLGNILLVDEKKADEARDIFARVIEELPLYPDGHYFMGSSLFDLGQYEQAVPYLKRCAELDPHGYTQGFDAMTLAGDALLKLGRVDEALAMFQAAKEVRPDSTYADYKIKVCQNGGKDLEREKREKKIEEAKAEEDGDKKDAE